MKDIASAGFIAVYEAIKRCDSYHRWDACLYEVPTGAVAVRVTDPTPLPSWSTVYTGNLEQLKRVAAFCFQVVYGRPETSVLNDIQKFMTGMHLFSLARRF